MPEPKRRHRPAVALGPQAGLLKPASTGVRSHATQASTTLVAEQKVDRENGHVYSEVEVRPSRRNNSDWIREFSTPHVVTKPTPNREGARSLGELARTKVVNELRNLTSEHFAAVPWTLAKKIWETVVETYGSVFLLF
jgi:hypothetical protein